MHKWTGCLHHWAAQELLLHWLLMSAALFCNLLYVLCEAIVTKGVAHYNAPCVLTKGPSKSCLFNSSYHKVGNGVRWQYKISFSYMFSFVLVFLPLQHNVLGVNRKPYICLLIQDTCCLFIIFQASFLKGVGVTLLFWLCLGGALHFDLYLLKCLKNYVNLLSLWVFM